jgi:hypothetical protein
VDFFQKTKSNLELAGGNRFDRQVQPILVGRVRHEPATVTVMHYPSDMALRCCSQYPTEACVTGGTKLSGQRRLSRQDGNSTTDR